MIDLRTGNKIIEASLGFYDTVTSDFIVVDPTPVSFVVSDTEDPKWLIVSYEDGDLRHKDTYVIMYRFSPQDVADAMTLHTQQARKAVETDEN